MKRSIGYLLLIFIFTFGMLWSQDKPGKVDKKDKVDKVDKVDKKKESKSAEKDTSRSLVMVEKVKPVPPDVKAGFESIDGEDGLAYLKFLSSDALEGRGTATKGYEAAAQFAATLFEAWGLKPAGDKPAAPSSHRRRSSRGSKKTIKPTRSFLQQVELREYLDSKGSAKVEWRRAGQYKAFGFESNVDYQYWTRSSEEFSAPVVFVGYGISEKKLKFDEYKGVDVKGKIVMMLSETPRKGDKDSPFEKGELKKKYYPPRSYWRRSRSPKPKTAMEKGAIAVLLVENSPHKNPDVAKRALASEKINDERPIYPGKRRRFSLLQKRTRWPGETIPTIRISRQMAGQILQLNGQKLEDLKKKIEKDMKPASMPLMGTVFSIKNKVVSKLVKSENVVGYIEGSDPQLKEEVVVIGAHLDHLGRRGDYIFNGADDNGSGSASVLEVAQAFVVNPVKPKRTVVFALWTGEESGLLGSRYYVSHPAFATKKTIAYINLDMVSRTYDRKSLKTRLDFMEKKLTDEELKKIDLDSTISFSYWDKAPDLMETFKAHNEYVGLTLITRKSSGGGGSDHSSFGRGKMAWVFLMGAMTENYHQTNDTYDRISIKLMQKTTRLSYLAAMALANR
jgi:hypothetical protein